MSGLDKAGKSALLTRLVVGDWKPYAVDAAEVSRCCGLFVRASACWFSRSSALIDRREFYNCMCVTDAGDRIPLVLQDYPCTVQRHEDGLRETEHPPEIMFLKPALVHILVIDLTQPVRCTLHTSASTGCFPHALLIVAQAPLAVAKRWVSEVAASGALYNALRVMCISKFDKQEVRSDRVSSSPIRFATVNHSRSVRSSHRRAAVLCTRSVR